MKDKDKEQLFKEIKEYLSKPTDVYVEVCNEFARLPEYKNIGDAGMDVYACDDVTIHPGETKVIPTGLKIAIEVGYEIQVRPRSGISLKTPLRVANTPGTIDAGYRDEVGVIISNTSELESKDSVYHLDESGNKYGTYNIRRGDRIAQIVLSKIEQINFVQVDSVGSIGTNRGGGFGHTGIGVKNEEK